MDFQLIGLRATFRVKNRHKDFGEFRKIIRLLVTRCLAWCDKKMGRVHSIVHDLLFFIPMGLFPHHLGTAFDVNGADLAFFLTDADAFQGISSLDGLHTTG